MTVNNTTSNLWLHQLWPQQQPSHNRLWPNPTIRQVRWTPWHFFFFFSPCYPRTQNEISSLFLLLFTTLFLLLPLAPKTGYSQGATPYTQTQQTRQVTTIKPATPSPATSTFSIYPVSSAVQPVAAAAASVVPSYSQSPTYSTNAVTYSGKNITLLFQKHFGLFQLNSQKPLTLI